MIRSKAQLQSQWPEISSRVFKLKTFDAVARAQGCVFDVSRLLTETQELLNATKESNSLQAWQNVFAAFDCICELAAQQGSEFLYHEATSLFDHNCIPEL